MSADEGENEPIPGETDEMRKRRLAAIAEEFKENRIRQEKRGKKMHLVPNLYGPSFVAPDAQIVSEVILKNLMPGVIFRYAD